MCFNNFNKKVLICGMTQSPDTEKHLLIRGWFSFWSNSRSCSWRYLSLASGYFQMFAPLLALKKKKFSSSPLWKNGRFYDPFTSKETTESAAQRYVSCPFLILTRTQLKRYIIGHWFIIPTTQYIANALCGQLFCEHLQWPCLDLNYISLNFETYCQWAEKNCSTTTKRHRIN